MKQRKYMLYSVMIAMLLIVGWMYRPNAARCMAKKKCPTYTISANSSPCDNSKKYAFYNRKTKQYYLILSYLKKLESKGGGTLILKKGTYTITNCLYVPSNVTIILKNGVVIKKGKSTGVKAMPASKSIFVLCPDSKKNKKGAFHKYNGVKNVNIVGKGTATIDLNYFKDALGIVMAHNKNINIQGVTFQNMYSGHFIEMDASKSVKVTKCTFKNHKDSEKNNKEAINLDTPDKSTQGFHAVWTSYDKTANYGVQITYCKFKNLERAIGTHKYSGGKYHTKITIKHNNIKNCDKDAIRVMNWRDFSINKNVIDGVGKGAYGLRAILISGAKKMRITSNVFKHVSRPIQLMPWKNSGPGEKYAVTYNDLSQSELEMLERNELYDADEYYIRINYTYNEFVQDTTKVSLV